MTTTDERSDRLAIDDLRNAWVVLSTEERVLGFGLLSADQAYAKIWSSRKLVSCLGKPSLRL